MSKTSTLADWKRHPVTQEVFSELKRRIDGLMHEVVGSLPGGDLDLANFKAGAIQAYRDVIDIELSEDSE